MKSLLAAAALAAAVGTWAAEAPAPAPWTRAADIDWKVSGSLPPGAEYHLIYENPETHGIQLLVRLPKGYALPPHTHSHDETIYVLSGRLELESQGRKASLGPGDYAVFPAGTPHAFKAAGWKGCEMLVLVSGPYDVKGLPEGK